jgi:two-component system response regulator NreC
VGSPYFDPAQKGDCALRIYLVDDHAIVREALRLLLPAKDPSLEVVGEAADGREAVAAIPGLLPDVVLVDILLRGMSGIAAIRELRRLNFRGKVVVLSAIRVPTFVAEAFTSGAEGYAIKSDGVDELLLALNRVTSGRRYLSPSLGDLESAQTRGAFDELSLREREIFNLVVSGYSNQRMADELFISVKTVETHRSRINRKLHVHSTAELIRLAALNGMVSP